MIRTLVVVALLSVFASCQSTKDAMGMETAMAVNPVCPISAEMVDPDADTVMFQGQTIGFCCNQCAGRWEEMSAMDREAAFAKINMPK